MVGLDHDTMTVDAVPAGAPGSAAALPATREINHENTEALPESCFEGPEKLLEIWFAPDEHHMPRAVPAKGLRSIAYSAWEDMLDLVQCKILSHVTAEDLDAYLLSESSMFVYSHKIILKTCGTTTLLHGVARILELAHSIGLLKSLRDQPWRVFYSRKSFMFPDRQHRPHSSWAEEVKFLDTHFDNGVAYMVGAMNSENWHLYLTTARPSLAKLGALHHNTEPSLQEFEDETLEILMSGLDKSRAQMFFVNEDDVERFDRRGGASEGHFLGSLTSQRTGMSRVYESSETCSIQLDSYLFTPCGYSANGVISYASRSGQIKSSYFTVHVTPEAHCSYASFETNVVNKSVDDAREIINKVLEIFMPSQFCATIFEAKPDIPGTGHIGRKPNELTSRALDVVPHYKRSERIAYEFDDYDLVFASFKRAT